MKRKKKGKKERKKRKNTQAHLKEIICSYSKRRDLSLEVNTTKLLDLPTSRASKAELGARKIYTM